MKQLLEAMFKLNNLKERDGIYVNQVLRNETDLVVTSGFVLLVVEHLIDFDNTRLYFNPKVKKKPGNLEYDFELEVPYTKDIEYPNYKAILQPEGNFTTFITDKNSILQAIYRVQAENKIAIAYPRFKDLYSFDNAKGIKNNIIVSSYHYEAANKPLHFMGKIDNRKFQLVVSPINAY